MRSFPPRPPTYVDTADVVPDESVRRALHGVLNITQLYSHQASAIEAYRHGDCDVVVTTPTASGKSLIYQLAVIDTLTNEPNARVLCLFPTKALARDQLRSMGALLKAIPHLAQHQVAAYDGDTPINSSSGGTMASMASMTAISGGIPVANERKTIREQCSVIVTNPDMLHTAILPGGMTYWRKVLYNLRLVVLDELHEYDALFGSHTALIMRRLLRLCHALGNDDVRFVSCSATIANPGDHLRLICGRNDDDNVRTVVVSNDGSPAAGKEYVLWQAPLLSKISQSASTAKNIHRNSMDELADIVVFLMHHGVRHIVFCKSRTTCERAHSVITSRLSRMSPASLNLQSRLATYRGGYSAVERRRIEQEMHDGTLLCVIATSALEIGIDVGDLDATVTLGIPRNISSLHQQAGRAGRRKKSALVIIVATNDYHGKQVCSKPELMFDMPSALLRVDVNEPSVLEAHLHCAASELPIALPDDTRYFPVAEDICTTALVYDELNQRARGTGKRVYLTHPRYQPHPSSRVSIRGTIEDTFVMAILRQHAPPSSRGIDIADRGNNVTGKVSGYVVLEEIEMSRALYQVYDDGVFLHGGKSYLMSVTKEYLEQKLAVVKPTSVKYVTRPDDSVSIITDSGSLQQSTILASSDTAEWTCRFGLITVQVQYYGYSKLTTATLTEIEKVDHPSPPQAFKTSGLWIDIPLSVVNELEARSVDVYVAAHGVSHMLGKIAENRVLGKPGFLQTECGAYVRSSNALSSGHDAGSSDAKNGEVDGESKVTSAGVLSAARILLYESKAGTSSSSTSAAAEMFGLCRAAYVSIKDILRDARTSIAECTCISAAEGEDRASHEELGSCVESSFDGGCRECIRGPGCRILMCTLSKSG
ncbi:P-loop containing nucleoside triphosphate hydrolase protein, partial [Ramicandelaber brevisporus]